MKLELISLIKGVLPGLNIEPVDFSIEHPADLDHGDYSTNIALIASKKVGKNPKEVAEDIKKALENMLPDNVERIEIAGPGFINFYLNQKFFSKSIKDILDEGNLYGKNDDLDGKKVTVEFTDPNPFKQFHIGHLMSNTIGESIARLYEWNGADVIRANYQGDVGPHVAKCIWGMMKQSVAFPHDEDSLSDKVKFLGDSYVYGAREYEENPNNKTAIDVLNQQIYKYLSGDKDSFDEDLHVMYTKGREWSLEHFEEIYPELGTKFDYYFFEKDIFQSGQDIVKRELENGVFEESEGAIVFRGDKYGLHTRVFLNSLGIPTYEAKEIGLAFEKEKKCESDELIVITANEQTEYFKVIQKAIEQFAPEISAKTKHIEHGMMRFKDGKMSSRTGNVVTGESLISDLKEVMLEKMSDREMDLQEKKEIAIDVAVGALKYSILRQGPGKNIIFDREQALSTEGDSGPYIQYTNVRANSILKKAEEAGIDVEIGAPDNWSVTPLEKKLYQFPEIVAGAYTDLAPQHLITYVTEVASLFNSFYASTQILDKDDPDTPYKLAITEATQTILTNGLYILGIRVPNKM